MRIDLVVPSGRLVTLTESPGFRSASAPLPSCSIRALSGTRTCFGPVFVATVRVRPAMLSTGPTTLGAAAGLGDGLGDGDGLGTAGDAIGAAGLGASVGLGGAAPGAQAVAKRAATQTAAGIREGV